MLRAALDWLAFSSVWVAAAAGALCSAASLALGAPAAGAVVGIAFAGTLFVYNVDRLRDLDRDRAAAPERSAFVERNARGLRALTLASGLAAAACAVGIGARPALLLAPVLALGLLHRRVKHLAHLKSLYITGAWIAVVVGLPVACRGETADAGWVAGVLAPAIFANAVAFNVRDREAGVVRYGRRRALRAARLTATAGVALAVAAPQAVRPLAAVPAATLVALLCFRSDERYGPIFVDGALSLGSVLAIAWLQT